MSNRRPCQFPRIRLNHAVPVGLSKTVSEMSPSLMYIHEGRDHRYWFGSDGQGVYLYDGKTITHFTTKGGLCSNRTR